jgi:hypothetical protein
MWTQENRQRYDPSHLRYESDLSDEEWCEVGPLIPPAKPGGNKRSVDIREVVNGVMYVLGKDSICSRTDTKPLVDDFRAHHARGTLDIAISDSNHKFSQGVARASPS